MLVDHDPESCGKMKNIETSQSSSTNDLNFRKYGTNDLLEVSLPFYVIYSGGDCSPFFLQSHPLSHYS